MSYHTWEQRYDAVVVAAWERWTKNGMGDMEWIAATLARLGWEDEA